MADKINTHEEACNIVELFSSIEQNGRVVYDDI